MKIKRKLHNSMFKNRQLRFFQYSEVNEFGTLNCYYRKWFIVLVFIPTIIIGVFTDGAIPTFRCLVELFTEPFHLMG